MSSTPIQHVRSRPRSLEKMFQRGKTLWRSRWKEFSLHGLAFEGAATPTGAHDGKEELQIMRIIGKG